VAANYKLTELKSILFVGIKCLIVNNTRRAALYTVDTVMCV